MDKFQLFAMLASQAPKLLGLLKNRGYDPGIMQDTVQGYADKMSMHPDSILAQAFTPVQAAEGDYATDLFGSKANVVNSDIYGPLNPNIGRDNLIDVYNNAINNEDNIESPAAALGAKMLLNNPDIGMEDPKKKLFKRLTSQ